MEYYKLIKVNHFQFYDAGALEGSGFEVHFEEDIKDRIIEVTDFRDVQKLESWYHGQVGNHTG